MMMIVVAGVLALAHTLAPRVEVLGKVGRVIHRGRRDARHPLELLRLRAASTRMCFRREQARTPRNISSLVAEAALRAVRITPANAYLCPLPLVAHAGERGQLLVLSHICMTLPGVCSPASCIC